MKKHTLSSCFRGVRWTIPPAFCFLVLMLCAALSFAQSNTGQIKGIVKDNAGAFVPGASVTLTHVASNLKFDRVTDESGRFLFPSIPVGQCELSVSAAGFQHLVEDRKSHR